jgi:hypothetical protein
MIKPINEIVEELKAKVFNSDLGVSELMFKGYDKGSLTFLGVDRDENIKTIIRLNTFDFSLHQTWETHKDLEFHIGYLKY